MMYNQYGLKMKWFNEYSKTHREWDCLDGYDAGFADAIECVKQDLHRAAVKHMSLLTMESSQMSINEFVDEFLAYMDKRGVK
jgi:hypothetical protein